jgi:hypothetical protein
MRRLLLLPVIALALPMLFAPVAAASPGQTADQLGQTTGWNVALDATTPPTLLAQTFTTPNKVERLDYIEVYVHGSTNGATVEAWVKAGAPGTSGIAGTDVTANVSAGFNNNWITLTPPTSITLAANSQYSIMFRVTDATHTTIIAGENHAEYYPDGAAYGYDGSAWTTPAPGGSEELYFQVFMSPLPGSTDQQQNAHATRIGIAVTAQTFVAGVTGSLDAISLWSAGTDGNQNVTVEICSTAAGIDCAGPAPAVAARPALAAGVLATSTVGVNHPDGQWNDFVFSPAPAIVAGTKYAIVVLGDAGWTGAATDAYGSGEGLMYEAGWSQMYGAPVFDLAFQTFVTAAAATPPPSIDPTQSPASGTTPPPTSNPTQPPASGPTPPPTSNPTQPPASGPTPPPTSVAGGSDAPGSPAPMPLLLVLAATISVALFALVKRHGVVTRQ